MTKKTLGLLVFALLYPLCFPHSGRSEERVLFSFDDDTEGWFVGGRKPSHLLEISCSEEAAKRGKGVLAFGYAQNEEVALGRDSFNEGPPGRYRDSYAGTGFVKQVSLRGTEGVFFWIKPSRKTFLLTSLTERDGSQYLYFLKLDKLDWEKIDIGYREFFLGNGSKDENHSLDPEQIWLIDIRDLEMQNKGKGPANTIWLDDFGVIEGEGAPQALRIPAAREIVQEGKSDFTQLSGDIAKYISSPASPVDLSVEKRKWKDGTCQLEYRLKDSAGVLVGEGSRVVNLKGGKAKGVLAAPQDKGIFALSFRLFNKDRAIDEGTQPLGVVTRAGRTLSPMESSFGTCVVSDFRRTSSPGEDYAFVDALGIRWYRPIVFWPEIEPKRGQYDWKKTDAQIEEGIAHGMGMAPLVAHVPKWAGTKGERSPPRDNQDFLRFMFDLTSRYQGKVRYWTIWNEQNSRREWPDWDPAKYVSFLKAGYLGAKKADPDVKILIGGLAFMDYDYLNDFYQAGGKEFFDIMNLHPYCFPDPPEKEKGSRLLRASSGKEASLMGLAKIRRIMGDFGDEKKPLWITEISWSTGGNEERQNTLLPFYVDEVDQARFLIRAHLVAFALGVQKCFILSVPDVSKKPQGIFGFPGLMTVEGIPKRSFIAYANMTALLDGAVVHHVLRLEGKEGYGVVFRSKESFDVVVLWHFGSRSIVRIQLHSDPERIVDILGNELTFDMGRKELDLEISPDPVFLLGPEGFCGKFSF